MQRVNSGYWWNARGIAGFRQLLELSVLAGGTASVYVGQPLDTVKVKMQTFPTVYRNAFHCFKTTLAQEGVRRGLYAGTVPSLAAQVEIRTENRFALGRWHAF